MSAPLRVALVAPFGLRPKGTTISRALPIGRQLARQGASVRLVIPPWDDPAQSGRRWIDESGVEMVHTRVRRRLTAPGVLADLLHQVADFNPDVVHAFKPIGYSGAAALWLGRRRGIATPRVLVDADDLEGPAGWAGRRRLRIGGRIRGIQEWIVLRTARRVTVASAWLGQYVARLGVPEEGILRLPNGFEPSPRQEVSSEIPRPCERILWYTRFTEATPSRAASLLAPLLVGPDAPRLAILGEEISPGDQRALVAALAAQGVAERVDWLGYEPAALETFVHTHGQSIVAVYPLDDDVVNRARCPSKVPQLMALGVPIVAEAIGELNHYLAGFESACLAPAGDAVGFRARVTTLLHNPAGRQDLAHRLQAAAAVWTWDQTTSGLLEFYRG